MAKLLKLCTSFLLFIAGLVLAVYAIHAGLAVNWDVPDAMITAHQSATAAWAFVLPAVPAVVCVFSGVALFNSFARSI
jgi:hypothetical protein